MVNHDLTTALLLEKLLNEQKETNTLLNLIVDNSAAIVDSLNELTASLLDGPDEA